MASHPGENTVEAYVSEAWHNITNEQRDFICKTYNANESLKQMIETQMGIFDEEKHSWRSWRNSIADYIDIGYPTEKSLIDYFLKYGPL